MGKGSLKTDLVGARRAIAFTHIYPDTGTGLDDERQAPHRNVLVSDRHDSSLDIATEKFFRHEMESEMVVKRGRKKGLPSGLGRVRDG